MLIYPEAPRYRERMTRPLQEIGLSVKRLQMKHHRACNAALAKFEISLVQWEALRHLDENPGLSLHALAELTFQSDQSFGTLAARMIERELIERVAGPGRAARHRLTPKGRALRRAGGKLVEGVLAKSLSALNAKELATFDAFLARLMPPPKMKKYPKPPEPTMHSFE